MWSHDAIRRILLDLSLKATERPFQGVGSLYDADKFDWKKDVGLDSLELMQLAALANSFFHIFDLPQPPYLLASTRIADWVEMVSGARQQLNERVSFHTSGTTGQTRLITHSVAYLQREINFLAELFSESTHVIPYVPSCSIYGFLLTVGVPHALHIPIVYPSEVSWTALPPGALVVATPFHWQWLLSSLPHRSLPVRGVSSTSPLPESLFGQITDRGVCLTELYGSTETGGIAYRQHANVPFTLFPYWEFGDSYPDTEIIDKDSQQPCALMDRVRRDGENTFYLMGRKDNKVNIAGVLTDLGYIQETIGSIPEVHQCTVSAKAIHREVVIQAHLTVVPEADQLSLEKEIRSLLRPHEVPRLIHYTIMGLQEAVDR
jgi:long-chain acyl-CoA synthetase